MLKLTITYFQPFVIIYFTLTPGKFFSTPNENKNLTKILHPRLHYPPNFQENQALSALSCPYIKKYFDYQTNLMQLCLTIAIVTLSFLPTTRNYNRTYFYVQSLIQILGYPTTIHRILSNQPHVKMLKFSLFIRHFGCYPLKTAIIFCKIHYPQPHHYRTPCIFTKKQQSKIQ